jgi:hypothetical protein
MAEEGPAPPSLHGMQGSLEDVLQITQHPERGRMKDAQGSSESARAIRLTTEQPREQLLHRLAEPATGLSRSPPSEGPARTGETKQVVGFSETLDTLESVALLEQARTAGRVRLCLRVLLVVPILFLAESHWI